MYKKKLVSLKSSLKEIVDFQRRKYFTVPLYYFNSRAKVKDITTNNSSQNYKYDFDN